MIPLAAVAIAQLFVPANFIGGFSQCLNILLSILLLYCAICQINLCFLAIYLFYTIYPLIDWIMVIGVTIQNPHKYYIDVITPQLHNTIAAVVIVVAFVFGSFIKSAQVNDVARQ